MVRSGYGMETTFFDEQYPERPIRLDLGRMNNRALLDTPVLSSPDLQLLKLGTPELEKLIIQNSMITTATPTPGMQVLFPPAHVPTEEQEMYARPFVEALDKLHHGHVETPTRRVYAVLDQLTDRFPAPIIKDDSRAVPSASSSPSQSAIDMDSQERIKLELKRERNRVAAFNCRRRKLDRISTLEEKVKIVKGENDELAEILVKLKEHVNRLKQKVLEHANGGCHIDSHF